MERMNWCSSLVDAFLTGMIRISVRFAVRIDGPILPIVAILVVSFVTTVWISVLIVVICVVLIVAMIV